MDDGKIIELFFVRDEKAIEELSKKYGLAMRAISYNILQNNEDADECVNDSYIGVWNSIPPNRPDVLYAYVCRIVRNISLTRCKYNRAKKRNGHYNVSLEEISEAIPAQSTLNDDADEDMLSQALNEWLGTLNRENLYIFMRRYWYMDSVEEISENAGLSRAAVYLRIDRMKKSLEKHLSRKGILK